MAHPVGRFVLRALTGLILISAARGQGFRPALPAGDGEPVNVSADRIEYDASGPYLIGHGNVRVRQGQRVIVADYVQVNTETEDAYARGNVELRRADEPVWRGEELLYNLRTGVGDFGTFSLFLSPYQVRGEHSEMAGPNLIEIGQVMLSPCEGEASREFRITARSARLRDQRYIRLRHTTAWLGPVPVLYSPFWWKDLEARGRWDVAPGRSSRLGTFLLTRYSIPLDERRTLRSRTQLHLYEYRGTGLGQDLLWNDPDAAVRGEASVFGLRDQRMYRSDEDRARRETYLDDPLRYRLRLSHTQGLTERDQVFFEATYLSDPYVQEDFFRREFRAAPQPENRFALTHRAEHYTASLLLHARLNDFFDHENRLPEVRLQVPRLQVGRTPVFYQGEHSAVALERLRPFDAEEDGYKTVRLDSSHRFFYPGQYLGFLSLTPRAGLRMTYYSETRDRVRTLVRSEPRFDEESGVWVEDPVEEETRTPGGSELRFSPEIGMAAFFKAFKVIDEAANPFGDGLRHVVEPYADYLWRPKPNIRPDHLYPFDNIDRVDLDHSLRLGVRNKLQTRRPRGIRDLVDADLFATFRIESLRDADVLGPIETDVRIRPTDRLRFDFDAAYDPDEGRVERFNALATVSARDGATAGLEYRYRADRRNLVSAHWSLRPERAWSLGGYQRFDLEESRLEEHGYNFTRRHDCVGWGIGVRHEPRYESGEKDEFRVWFQIWLLAEPETGMQWGG